ncbi:hypothetical protein VOLCADRAFT_119569 [Volvox carteri f. nagariensis]|uniref:Cytochrome P450 n=1 Tax=Volvox carteri f. nagariensis TaxID=3068 RepID=D8UEB8_VOLCA|nr:uncharacterized protein VOLCADRAFT_119569 [Volvox carteri f. nagariensis]EFJ41941.1 hypothetical protein VOLCADRAFT_119569 [Volvox carteri f. nagariensis]|eukprot:XP_002956978.1 hypothetical protein VOLCADRAFT_119569 [Volvox carteri f. nagariensis]
MFVTDLLAAQLSVWFAVVFGAILVVAAFSSLVWSRQGKNDAALVPGLPILGNALALGRHGVSYINKCRRKFGDSFTLSLAGVKMTFLFEPSHIHYFFSAPDEKVTFRPAIEQFTQRVFGLTSRVFFPLHSKMLKELRELLVPAMLTDHMQSLGTRALQLLPSYVHHDQVDLCSLCRSLVFHCAVESVFGRRFVDHLPELLGLQEASAVAATAVGDEKEEGELRGRHSATAAGTAAMAGQQQRQGFLKAAGEAAVAAAAGELGEALRGTIEGWQQQQQQQHGGLPPRPPAGVEWLARTFFTFEDQFELATSPLPHAFLPEFVKSRSELLRVFLAADRRGLFQGTPAGEMLDRTTGSCAQLRPNMLLALIWASQANTIPAVFWSTAFLLLPENAVHKASVISELERELQSKVLSAGGPAAAATTGGPEGADSRAAAVEGSSSADTASPRVQPSRSELVAAATRLAANRRSAVSRCVAEALRLRVQSIDVRQAAAPLDLPSQSGEGARLQLPRGRLLAVCPFESHHDKKLCGAVERSGEAVGSDPWVYDPCRPEVRLGDGSAVLPSVAGLAFGGGQYRCPGRFFAEHELGLLVQLLLWSYDMSLSYGDAASRAHGTAEKQAPSKLAETVKRGTGSADVKRTLTASSGASESNPDPQLQAVQGGSFLYAALATLLGPSAMAWGFGWFDGLDGPMQEWRESGDPAGLLPPCDLRRLVGVKVPRKPCWVQLGRIA